MNAAIGADEFHSELDLWIRRLDDYLLDSGALARFRPDDIREAATLYIAAGGKRLRPAILLWSCGAVGGDPLRAIPAAAAVEVFHTWTLVHDDIIDRDDRRRGTETVHTRFRRLLQRRHPGLSDDEATHYGKSIAILAGDVQHGWNVTMITELSTRDGLAPEVTLTLLRRLNDFAVNELIEGELLDIQYARRPLSDITVDDVELMLRKKTGVLYHFSAWAGGLIGRASAEADHPHVRALGQFAERCGLAFQLQDDVLGVAGDPEVTGKPVGGDIREGKRTTIVLDAWREADPAERSLMEEVLGDGDASDEAVGRVIDILRRRGGIERAHRRAQAHIDSALPLLDELPDTRWRRLLGAWADTMIHRDL